MNEVILDASITTGWLLEDEQDNRSLAVQAQVHREGAIVPRHWHFEVANSLLFAERRGRLQPGRAKQQIRSLSGLPIHLDDSPDIELSLDLATSHGLTLYDAVYLELALRTGPPLATLDRDLLRVASGSGVELFSV
ncbi:MAG: type II toxin-antitoxin system VapC family toxin [Chloroflexota bacterium]|nr:type II toxin-antitoxin system VapC family toxin [Chloroflexota bacterium]MDE2894961.1 type II toxin-antitoxin system VapC family toxin [Chloroflexota bacterium]